MAWNVRTAASADDVEQAVADLTTTDAASDVDAQVKAAKKAAAALIRSGALGAGPAFHVVLSGHANPGHETPPPTAAHELDPILDQVAVSITQITTEQLDQFRAEAAATQSAN